MERNLEKKWNALESRLLEAALEQDALGVVKRVQGQNWQTGDVRSRRNRSTKIGRTSRTTKKEKKDWSSAMASQEYMRAATTASSMLLSHTIFLQRVARTQSSVVRSRAKLNLHLSKLDTTDSWRFLLLAQIFSQSLDHR